MITGAKVRLRNRRLGDARKNYEWQTDTELAHLDAATPLTTGYTQYLVDYAWELHFSPFSGRQFAVETLDGKHIGNCSYYDVNESQGSAELGVMIGDREYWDKGYGTGAVTTLVNHIFQETNLNRIYLKTLGSNIRAQRCFAKCGFSQYGRLSKDGYDFTLMELHRDGWQREREESSIMKGAETP